VIRIPLAGWGVAFSERGDGDLRASGRAPGESRELVVARLLGSLGLDGAAVARQHHSADVAVLDAPVSGYSVGFEPADGIVTGLAGVAVGVHVADCLPIALGSAGAVSMLHCGWRGLSGGIVGEGVRALRALGADGPLEAVIGPGAGGCCYETGEEVRERFSDWDASRGRLLDLKAVAAAQLREAGVSTVADVGLCTICAPERRFFSHRRDGASTGRQGGYAWLG
jgi:YfiH family protein